MPPTKRRGSRAWTTGCPNRSGQSKPSKDVEGMASRPDGGDVLTVERQQEAGVSEAVDTEGIID